jgi:hypothetical protein
VIELREKTFLCFEAVFSCLAACVFAAFQNALPFVGVAIPCAIFLMLALRYRCKKNIPISRKENIALLLFSLIFSIASVASHNVIVPGNAYTGLATTNYLDAWGLFDWFGLIVIWLVAYILFSAVYAKITKMRNLKTKGLAFDVSKKVSVRFALALALLIFVAYVPYWLAYWPGLIYADSISSISQALSGTYSNHHPVAYTLTFTLCIKFMHLLGFSTTSGCALQVLFQMLITAGTLGCFSAWIQCRFGLPKWVGVMIACFFAFTPYFALYSISMWKDPLFSMMVVIVTMGIADVALGGGNHCIKKRWWVAYFCAFVGCGLLRSNGVYILAGIVLIYFLTLIFKRGSFDRVQNFKLLGRSAVLALVCVCLIVGPVYGKIGATPASKAEAYGLMINQMARVVVEGGVMSEEDADYMNQLLPLEEYAEVYTPTCIDSLKWNENFSNEALHDGFLRHWASMFVKNPKIYLDGWVMQTFGYWAPIHAKVIFHYGNFKCGEIYNTDSSLISLVENLGIDATSKIPVENIQSILSTDAYLFPIGPLNWGIAFLILCLILQKQKKVLLVLLPGVLLVATLLIASPIWYWPRYESVVEYSIPLFIVLYCCLPNVSLVTHSANRAEVVPDVNL